MVLQSVDVSRTLSAGGLVFEALRRAIIEGDLKDGDPIRQDEIARLFNTSRIPVREAIARHSWAGFAERLVGFFELVTRMPEVATSAVGADSAAADAAALSAVLSSRTWRATAPLRKLSRRRKP